MSENRSEPDFTADDENFEDRELGSLLRKLEPSPLEVRLLDELHRDHERIAETDWPKKTELRWKRLIPLSFAAIMVFFSYAAFQYAPLLERETSPAIAKNQPTLETTGSASSPPVVDGFLPVSAQGYLVDSAPSGVIETEEGPRQKWNLKFRDAYHWHDPETDTNIRFFEPRNEEMITPLQTD